MGGGCGRGFNIVLFWSGLNLSNFLFIDVSGCCVSFVCCVDFEKKVGN